VDVTEVQHLIAAGVFGMAVATIVLSWLRRTCVKVGMKDESGASAESRGEWSPWTHYWRCGQCHSMVRPYVRGQGYCKLNGIPNCCDTCGYTAGEVMPGRRRGDEWQWNEEAALSPERIQAVEEVTADHPQKKVDA